VASPPDVGVTAPTPRGRLFDGIAGLYDEVRPDYPDELYDALDAVSPLRGAHVLDVAAGTGVATRQLRARGASVVVAEPGVAMLRALRARSGDVPAVAAAAERLPFVDGRFDLVCVATAWHWLDARAALAEARRVLRPGGHLALWWANHLRDDGVEWEAAQGRVHDAWRLRTGSRPPHQVDGVGPRDAAADLRRRGLDVVVDIELHWSRVVSREQHVRVLATHSDTLALGARAEQLLADVRVALDPWPEVEERLWGPLVVARMPAEPAA
jgi:SAM-dependent methyltransferase